MVPNGSWGESNAGLVIGQHEALLIDTLWDPPKTRLMLKAMRTQLGKARLNTVVNTHADGDHFWGNECVSNADIITSENALAEMEHHKPKSMRAFAAVGRMLSRMPGRDLRKAGHYFQTMCAPYDFASVTHTPAKRGFSGSMDLSIGGRDVRLIEVGPAHTSGDLIVHIPDAKTLFAADILFIGSTPVMWAGPVENWLSALDMVLDMDVDVIIPGHGPVTGKDGVRAVRDYWNFTVEAARKRFDTGTQPERAAFEITRSETFRKSGYQTWDSPERMMTNVHLLYRHWSGKTAAMGIPAKVNLMRKQAVLAHAMTDACPGVMRKT